MIPGFSKYTLSADGKVYNIKGQEIGGYNHIFKLIDDKGQRRTISLKKLYRLKYNKNYCDMSGIVPLHTEVFKEVPGSDGLYMASNLGRVISLVGYKAIIMKISKNQKGYSRVELIIRGQRKVYLVSHLVASCFLAPAIGLDKVVHHINHIRDDDRAINLQIMDRQEHMSYHNKLRQESKENGKICELEDNYYQA